MFLRLFSLAPFPLFKRQSTFKSGFWLTTIFLVLFPGVEEVISLERALQGLFDDDLECRGVYLLDTIPPPVSGRGIEATIGSESATSADEDSDLQDIVVTDASQKDPSPSGSLRSLCRVKRHFAFLEASSGGHVETVDTEPPLRKKCSLSFLLGGSKGCTRAPNESPLKLLEGAHNRATESPSPLEKDNIDMANLDPTAGGSKAKAGSSPSQGVVSTASSKTGTVPPSAGSHVGAYMPSWSLTP